MKKIIIAILLIILLSSCNPYRFRFFNPESRMPIIVRNLSNLGDVEKETENSMFIKKGATAALRKFQVLEFIAEFNIEMIEGDEFDIYLRQVPHEFNENKGIRINIKNNFFSTYEDNILIDQGIIEKTTQEDLYIKLVKDGKHLKFQFNCAETYLESYLVETEYLIVKNSDNTLTRVYGIIIDKF